MIKYCEECKKIIIEDYDKFLKDNLMQHIFSAHIVFIWRKYDENKINKKKL
jgi:hypothetical protein